MYKTIEKTGSIDNTCIPLEIQENKVHIWNYKSLNFFVTFAILLFDSGVCLPFDKENELS